MIPDWWGGRLLSVSPGTSSVTGTDSAFNTTAEVITSDPREAGRILTFSGPRSWFEAGLWALVATHWRPGCAVTDPGEIRRIAPPGTCPGIPLTFGTPHSARWLEDFPADFDMDEPDVARRTLTVEAPASVEAGWALYVCVLGRRREWWKFGGGFLA